ncbi:hypothetical protein LCGC14_2969230 [marine sediment metagenome]|uniref:Uncharacterized protein n=1 Tax=marine sediment metagenome TaxID=412755 RepID=A0A0F9A154_9ZZZZ
MTRRKKFTVGLWMDLVMKSGDTIGLQMWNIQLGAVKDPQLKWHTVVLAKDEDKALQLGQAEYASKNIEKKVQAA